MNLADLFRRKSNFAVETAYVTEKGKLVLAWSTLEITGIVGTSEDYETAVLYWESVM